jgi:hypothetical protein
MTRRTRAAFHVKLNGRLRRWRKCVEEHAMLGCEHRVVRPVIGAEQREQSADVSTRDVR